MSPQCSQECRTWFSRLCGLPGSRFSVVSARPGSEADDLRHIVGNAVSIALVLLSFSTVFTYLRWRLRVSPHILIRLAERSIRCPARAGRDLPRPSQHYPPRRCRSGRAARRTGRRPALVRIRRPRTLPVHRRRRRRGGEQARTPGPHGLTDTSYRGIHRVHHAPGLGRSSTRFSTMTDMKQAKWSSRARFCPSQSRPPAVAKSSSWSRAKPTVPLARRRGVFRPSRRVAR